MTDSGTADPRPPRTRDAILRAFAGLVIGRPYEGVRVEHIARGAGVGRSTFYEHFRGKDDLLVQSMSPLLEILADAAAGAGHPAGVRMLLEHFGHNRRRARALFNSPTARTIGRALADRIEARTRTAAETASLVAAQAAEAQMGLLRAWLGQTRPCGVDDLTPVFLATSAAIVQAAGGATDAARP